MSVLLLGIGVMLVIEGLVYALAPQLVEQLLAALRELSLEQRRLFGLAAVTLGVALLWFAGYSGVTG